MSAVPLLLLPLVVALARCTPVNPDGEDFNTSDPQPPLESVHPDEPDNNNDGEDDDDNGTAKTSSKTSTKTRSKTKSRSKTRSRTSTKKPSATKPVHGPIIQQPSPTLTSSGSSLPTQSPAAARAPSRHSVAGTVLGALFGSIAGVILVVFVLRWYSIWQRRRRQQQRSGGASSPNTRQIQGQWVSSQTGRASASSVEPPPPYYNAPAYDTPQAAAAPFSYTAGAHTPR